MMCDLLSQCNFLYGFFNCQLPEDTIDIEVTVRTLKGINTYRGKCTSQKSTCSPWSPQVRPFSSLICKMEPYMQDRRNAQNPFDPN